MTEDHNDLILESFVREIVQGASPPDLTERIVHAWRHSRSAVAPETTLDTAPTVSDLPIVTPFPSATPPIKPASGIPIPNINLARGFSKRRHRPKLRLLLGWSSAAAIVAALGVVALLTSRPASDRPVVKNSKSDSNSRTIPKSRQPDHRESKSPQLADKHRAGFGELPLDSKGPEKLEGPFSAESQPFQPSLAGDRIWKRPAPLPSSEIIQSIDESIARMCRERSVAQAEPASDAEWCRRVYLRLIGRIPTVDELSWFSQSRLENKRQHLVEMLLESSDYVRNWSELFTNVLIGRTGGVGNDDLADRSALQMYLEEAFAANKRYDVITQELLTASGSNRASANDFNGAVNFLLSGWNKNATLATSRSSRIFLGRQINCVQCHNDPMNDARGQGDFWQLNAFFRQVQVQKDPATGAVKLIDGDFAGDGGTVGQGEVYYEQRDGRMKVAYPVFPNGMPGPQSGLLSAVNRRKELADYIVRSPDLAQATVNRLWSHFFGYGFTKTVDDMGPQSTVSHPELLETLAGQFAAHQYDLKQLFTWIALSEPFAASSRSPSDSLADSPEEDGTPLFSRYYARPMHPEEVFESLQLVARARQTEPIENRRLARVNWLGQFSRNMGNDEGDEVEHFRGDISQAVVLMTGPLMQQATSLDEGHVLRQVIDGQMTLEEKVDHLFLSALSRRPAPHELDLVRKLCSPPAQEREGLQDIWWALLNSNEFIVDH